MQIKDIVKAVDATVLTDGLGTEISISRAFSSDLMSDVLTLETEGVLLITGLNNLQTIRTAEMADIQCILFARNKKPSAEMLELAKKENMVLLCSEKSVFHVSGILFKSGLKPVY